MREQSATLESLNVRVFAVTFESSSRVASFQREEALPFSLLRDPGRRAYQRFGLGRRPITTIWGLETLWYYGRRLLGGELPKRSEGADRYQLGGDVILRADRSGGWVYRSANPADRPLVAGLLEMLKRVG